VVLDARSAAPISITIDRPGLRDKVVAAGYSRFTPDSALFTGILGDTFDRILIGQVGDPLPRQEMVADISGMWTIPDANGDVTRSTITYNLAWFDYGQLPHGFTRNVVDSELARVDTTYRAQQNGKRATKVWTAREPELGVAVGQGLPFRLPLERIEYHNVDNLQWSGGFEQWSFVKKLVHTEAVQTGGIVSHQAGQSYEESWNTAVSGPGFAGDIDWAARFDDTLFFNIPMYSDAGLDHYGSAETTSGSTILYQNGVKAGETQTPGVGQFAVTPDPAAYRLETRSTRDVGISAYSTQISCVWTFTSVHPPAPDPKGPGKGKGGNALPLMSIRFAPPNLNSHNEIGPGLSIVPVTVQRPQNAPEATVSLLDIDISLDDGQTWRPAQVTRDLGAATATVLIDHPSTARYVSLRGRAMDSAGGTVEETVVRAYGIR
jgi:hypothetical protein